MCVCVCVCYIILTAADLKYVGDSISKLQIQVAT
jgi:hypothetical protein